MLLTFWAHGRIEAGCDEAGRGALAGPVYAAAVILSPYFYEKELNDSKLLNEKQRYKLRTFIQEEAIAWAVASATAEEIDNTNILRASVLAMHRAVKQLKTVPDHLLVDGDRFVAYPGIPHTTIVRGDSRLYSIAAASVLAKTYRDEYMEEIHNEYPAYCWDSNKGYPTNAHREAIIQYGVTPYHRRTFQLLSPLSRYPR